MTIRRWVFCGFGIKEKVVDPRKISQFIEDVMDPYGSQDKYLKELKEQEEKEKKEFEKKREEDKKKLLKIFKNNKEVVDHLYDKIEKGELYSEVKYLLKEIKTDDNIINLKKIGNIVNLIGDNENVKLNINIDDCDKHSKRSDSSNSLMDFDVICDDDNDNFK